MSEASIHAGWDRKPIKAVAKITTGDKDTKDRVENGLYPFFVRSQTVERINSVGFDGEGVLTAGDGVGTGKIFHYINGKCDFHQRVYLMHSFSEGVTGRYFFYYFSHFFYDRIMAMTAKSSVDSVRREMIADMEILFPKDSSEQDRVVAALSDADGVVAGLERVIAKKRLIKQGAMQDLLTARRRLPGFSGEWEVKRLGDHVRFLKNGTHSRAQLSEHGPVKNLHYGDIHGAASIFLSPATKPMPTLDSLSAGRLDRLAAGDLVFVDASEDLAGVGTSVEVTDLGATEVVSGLHTIAARFDKSILVDGFKAFLQFMPAFRSHLCQLAAGTKVLATNRRHISSAEIALPRPDEQQAIATVLSDMDAEIQTLESRLAKARAVKEGMMQTLLTGRVRLV
ncbi:restriction endonuclease subunit S [Gemmobacter nectariphilus]|uniref:restriction endonuclease subunit S n=1 Tax=Gemmobacter nectariphilus TaxID=220343 RepID=UPI0003F62813|nr:restriction endonuclease subunit S [Gemmobacter nectariphilus]